MSMLIIAGVIALGLVTMLAVVVRFGAMNRRARLESTQREDAIEAARAGALWEVHANNDFSRAHMIVYVQRRARYPWGPVAYGDKIVVKSIEVDDESHDVKLNAALTSARQRAEALNATLVEGYIAGQLPSASTTGRD